MKKISSIIIVTMFFGLLLLPQVVDRLMKTNRSTLKENRNLTAFPTEFKYRKISSQLEEYYNDRIPFRAVLVKSCRELQSKLFAFMLGKAFPGKNDFLFFRKPGWEDQIDQFRGKGPLRSYTLAKYRKFLLDFNGFLARRNIQFLLVIAPNKVQIYPEHLPERRKYPESELMPDLQLVRFMKQHNPEIAILHLRQSLLEAKKYYADHLFYRVDTHWSPVGGYIGAKEIIEHFDPQIKLPEVGKFSLKKSGVPEDHDILNQILTAFENPGYPELKPDIPAYNGEVKEIRKAHLYSYNANAPDKRRVLMYRDSFAHALIPYISNHFREVHYIRSHKVSAEQIATIKPDIVILEYVARIIPRMQIKIR